MSGERQRPNLEVASKVIALAGTGCLLLSIIYDWGFLRAVGLSFSTIPTSLADHFRGALNWLPTVIAAIGGAVIFEIVSRRIEGGKTEAELLAGSRRPRALRLFRDSPQKFFGVMAFLTIGLWLLLGDQFREGLYLLVPVIWFQIAVWVVSHPRIRASTPREMLLAIAFIPPVVLYVYLLGGNQARAALVRPEEPAVVLVPEAIKPQQNLYLVRVFERVAIVRDDSGKVVLVRSGDILRIVPAGQRPFRGLLCYLWRRACITPTNTPPNLSPSKTP